MKQEKTSKETNWCENTIENEIVAFVDYLNHKKYKIPIFFSKSEKLKTADNCAEYILSLIDKGKYDEIVEYIKCLILDYDDITLTPNIFKIFGMLFNEKSPIWEKISNNKLCELLHYCEDEINVNIKNILGVRANSDNEKIKHDASTKLFYLYATGSTYVGEIEIHSEKDFEKALKYAYIFVKDIHKLIWVLELMEDDEVFLFLKTIVRIAEKQDPKLVETILMKFESAVRYEYWLCNNPRSLEYIPKGMKYVSPFSYRGSLKKTIELPCDIQKIGVGAFEDCIFLTDICIPQSVTEIAECAFSGCELLENIVLPSNITSIRANTFYRCNSLTNIIIPSNVETIGKSAFRCSTSLTQIDMPKKLKVIRSFAFADCNSLNNVVLPKNMESIESAAFMNCTSLESILIPESVTMMDIFAFSGCTALKNIYCEAKNKPDGWSKNWLGDCSARVFWNYRTDKNESDN